MCEYRKPMSLVLPEAGDGSGHQLAAPIPGRQAPAANEAYFPKLRLPALHALLRRLRAGWRGGRPEAQPLKPRRRGSRGWP